MSGKVQPVTLSAREMHRQGKCGCSTRRNPNRCVYQPFLDGWSFTPDVGNGSSRGEIFTPRFVVDKMIVDSGILPKRVVYDLDYRGSQDTLRKYIGSRVFESAVGTGNFVSTILWHKLELAHRLTGYTVDPDGQPRKTDAQRRRYEAYTLVALASCYFNDIDPGNLQTTKWRLLRDSEIGADVNIVFWTDHIASALEDTLSLNVASLRASVEKSIKEASANWGTKDRDRGVLDDLYEKHTGIEAPEWLRSTWKLILDKNGLLFNGINEEDEQNGTWFCPGWKNVEWVFWRFENHRDEVIVHETYVPLRYQLLVGELREIEQLHALIPRKPAEVTLFDVELGEPETIQDRKEARRLAKRRNLLEAHLAEVVIRDSITSRINRLGE